MYVWVKALHVVAIISWMAAMLYLPRLYVYHAATSVGSESSEMLKVMERRLLRFICTPAMIISWLAGLYLLIQGSWMSEGWMHVKLTMVLLLSAYHGWCAMQMKRFGRDERGQSQRYYRIANEVPAVLMIVVVIAVVVKPF